MITIKIDSKTISVEEGTSILSAAQQLSIKIPAMCYNEDTEHFTSCMVCLVKDVGNNKLIPACSVHPTEGMEIITLDAEIKEARKTALELLLSEHVGDCEAPCTIACNAHMNIPLMNRLLSKGEIDKALSVVRNDIVLPATLGLICPAPCEGACRRKPMDGTVSICMLKRYAGEYGKVQLPEIKEKLNKRAAIIGSGPAGLSAAWFLQIKGIDCTIFDKTELAGGNLQYVIPDNELPKDVLQNEISFIKEIGVQFKLNKPIDKKEFEKLTQQFDVIVIATGDITDEIKDWGVLFDEKQVQVNKTTYQTNLSNVFAVGNVTRSSKYAIRSLAQGKEVAESIVQFFNNEKITGPNKIFNSRFGRLYETEFVEYLKESVLEGGIEPSGGIQNGYSLEEVKQEAERCLHCDCRKLDNCVLRDLSDEYIANQRRFKTESRKKFVKTISDNGLVFESTKCIKCGICVRLTEKHKEELGLTFIGRGFDIEVGVPLNETLSAGLKQTAKEVVNACPTGALALNK